MINNLFDKHVQKQFGQYKPEVPAHIWENIAKSTTQKKPLFYWFNNSTKTAAILLVTLVMGAAFYFYNQKSAIRTAKKNEHKNIVNVVTVKQSSNSNSTTATKSNQKSTQLNTSVQSKVKFQKNNNINTFSSTNTQTLPSSKEQNKNLNGLLIFNNADENSFSKNGTALMALNSNYNHVKFIPFFNPKATIPTLPIAKNIPCPEAEKNTAGNKKYVELYASPDYTFTSVTDTSNSTYRMQRQASNKLLLGYSAGVRITKVFSSGMSIRTGINYSVIKEQFTAKKGSITQNVYIINNMGDTTGTYTVTSAQYKKSTNTYSRIDVPITAGFEVGNGRLHTNINAGAVINIYSKQKGLVLDNNGNEVDLSNKNAASSYSFKPNAGVSLLGAVSIYYKLTDKLHVMAEPYVRYSLSPVTKQAITYSQKYHTAGLKIGLRADF